jgi:hypothetical protein
MRPTGGSGSSSWATPTANDASGSTHAYSSGDHSKLALKLNGQVRNHAGRQGLDADPRAGQKVSLNPLFVERLMGFPPNWSIARTGCGVSETAWSRWLQRMRSALSQLDLRKTKEDAR